MFTRRPRRNYSKNHRPQVGVYLPILFLLLVSCGTTAPPAITALTGQETLLFSFQARHDHKTLRGKAILSLPSPAHITLLGPLNKHLATLTWSGNTWISSEPGEDELPTVPNLSPGEIIAFLNGRATPSACHPLPASTSHLSCTNGWRIHAPSRPLRLPVTLTNTGKNIQILITLIKVKEAS